MPHRIRSSPDRGFLESAPLVRAGRAHVRGGRGQWGARECACGVPPPPDERVFTGEYLRILCGLVIGSPIRTLPANAVRVPRNPLDAVVRFVDEEPSSLPRSAVLTRQTDMVGAE